MDLKKLIADFKKNAGVSQAEIESQIAQAKENELTKVQENANEVMHTTNTGFGAELIPVDQLTSEIINAIPNYASFVQALPGYHGANMGKSVSVPILGDIGFAHGYDERTSDALAHGQATRKLATDKVTITQQTLYARVDLSMQQLLYSSVEGLETIIKNRLARSFARTIESAILNGDDRDTATGNINAVDIQPSTVFADGAADHRLLFNGLRKAMLAGTVNVDFKDIGALAWANLIETRGLMNQYSLDLQDMILLLDNPTYTKALTLPEFADAYKNGVKSTVMTGAWSNISGVDMYVSSVYPKTRADGFVYNAGANTKGGFLYFKKNAVQYGYGMPLAMETYNILGQGVSIVACLEFGFAVVNKRAGETDPRVVGGINVTV